MKTLLAGLANGFEATTDPQALSRRQTSCLFAYRLHLPPRVVGLTSTAVTKAAETVGEHITPDTLVILESTTYPGTTEEVFAPLVTTKGFGRRQDVFVAFSPERIDPGNHDLRRPQHAEGVGGITRSLH